MADADFQQPFAVPFEGPHRHRVQDLVADDHAAEVAGVASSHSTRSTICGSRAAMVLRCRRRRSPDNFDDLVAQVAEPLPVERVQQLRSQRAAAGAELDDQRLVGAAARQPRADLARQRGAEQRRELRRGHEIAARSENRLAAAVVAQPGLVERHRHVAVEADPAAGRARWRRRSGWSAAGLRRPLPAPAGAGRRPSRRDAGAARAGAGIHPFGIFS